MKALLRTLRSDLKENYKQEITVDSPLYSWAVRHSGWTHCRYEKAKDGTTPYERVYGAPCKGGVVQFGERVLALDSAPHRRHQEKRFFDAIWVGKSEKSDEHLLLTPHGVRRARTVRRLPEEEHWDKDLLKAVRGLPWRAGSLPLPLDKPAEPAAQGALDPARRVQLEPAVVLVPGPRSQDVDKWPPDADYEPMARPPDTPSLPSGRDAELGEDELFDEVLPAAGEDDDMDDEYQQTLKRSRVETSGRPEQFISSPAQGGHLDLQSS